MPAYDYECEACEQRFEVRRHMNDAAPAACPECGSGPVRRVYTPFGVLKGTPAPLAPCGQPMTDSGACENCCSMRR
jgi:putative FmdB family regulatory protein